MKIWLVLNPKSKRLFPMLHFKRKPLPKMKKHIIILVFLTTLLNLIRCNKKTEKKSSDNNRREIQMINPNDILMTLPTIENIIPETNQDQKETLNLEILEDDWRQLEFISREFLELIKKEIDSINLIIKNESVNVGDEMTAFKKLHVRTSIPKPLKNGIEWMEFEKEFSSIKTGTLSFNQYGRINHGIYMEVSDFNLYALLQDSKITTLGFYGLSSWDKLDTFKTEIKKIMNQHNLVLVDWKARMILETDGIDDYLNPNK